MSVSKKINTYVLRCSYYLYVLVPQMKILFVSTEPTMYVANNFLTSLEPNLVNRLEVDDYSLRLKIL